MKLDKTYTLLKSLNKSEKRFFKIYSSRHVIGKTNNYVELFDAMDKQQVYDEQQIKKIFANEKFVKRMPVAKAYLYDLILKSMSAYQQNNTATQLYDNLKQVQFLFAKKLYQQAEQLLSKTKKLAQEQDQVELMPEIMRWQKKLMDLNQYNISKADLDDFCKEETEWIDNLELINKFWKLQSELYIQHNNYGIVKNEQELEALEGVFNERFMQLPDYKLPFRAKLLKNKIYGTYFFQIRDFQSSYNYVTEMIQLLEESAPKSSFYNKEYVQAINNLLNLTQVLNLDVEHNNYLAKLRKLYHNIENYKTVEVKTPVVEAFHYHSMNFILKTGLYQEGLTHQQLMEADLKKHNKSISATSKTMLYFFAFHINFNVENFEKAYNYLFKIKKHEAQNNRIDIINFCNILLPLTAYELGDYKLLKTNLKNLYRYLWRKENKTSFENFVFNAIKDLPKHKESVNWFKACNQQLELHKADDCFMKAFHYFKFADWLACKLQNKSYGKQMLVQAMAI